MSPGQDAVKEGKLNGIHVAAPTPSTSPFISLTLIFLSSETPQGLVKVFIENN